MFALSFLTDRILDGGLGQLDPPLILRNSRLDYRKLGPTDSNSLANTMKSSGGIARFFQGDKIRGLSICYNLNPVTDGDGLLR